MQGVVMGGGFITNAVHTGWIAGADAGDIDEGAGGPGFPRAPAALPDDRLRVRRDLRSEETEMKLRDGRRDGIRATRGSSSGSTLPGAPPAAPAPGSAPGASGNANGRGYPPRAARAVRGVRRVLERVPGRGRALRRTARRHGRALHPRLSIGPGGRQHGGPRTGDGNPAGAERPVRPPEGGRIVQGMDPDDAVRLPRPRTVGDDRRDRTACPRSPWKAGRMPRRSSYEMSSDTFLAIARKRADRACRRTRGSWSR